MSQVIVYKREDGIGIITPAPGALQRYTIQEVADKDVPVGRPYKIMDVSEIPTDRTFRNAWDIDETELTDGIGADRDLFLD